MADSVSTEAWLDQRRWAALEEALKAQGSNALTVCLVCSDGHEFEFFYPLTSAEQVQLWNQMDAYCHQQNGQSLGETRTALLREQAEEGLEIRL